MIRVLIVEDQIDTASGLRDNLAPWGEIEVVGVAHGIVGVAASPSCDVAVVDLNLDDVCRRCVVPEFQKAKPEEPVLIRTGYANPVDLLLVVAQGAQGYIAKSESIADLVGAIGVVSTGGFYVTPELAGHLARNQDGLRLTTRELEVLKLIASRGYTDAEIARELYVSQKTVRGYLDSIHNKARGLLRPGAPRSLRHSPEQLTTAALTVIATGNDWSAGGVAAASEPDGHPP